MDKVAELMVLSMKRAVFMDERIAQKRDTLERVSQYMALSREERLKNRGRPWPREREVVNEKRDTRRMSRSEQS